MYWRMMRPCSEQPARITFLTSKPSNGPPVGFAFKSIPPWAMSSWTWPNTPACTGDSLSAAGMFNAS